MANDAEIPIIDIAGDQTEAARQLVEAAENHGFIYIKNLGRDIPAADIAEAFKLVG